MALFSVHAKGPLEALLRLVGVLAIMGLAALGFWKNGERNAERVALLAEEKTGLTDPAHALDKDSREHVLAFIAALRRDYGLAARVRVAQTLGPAPELDAKTLCIELGVEEKKARVALPPLMAGALGPSFARSLEQEHFPFHFAPGRDWKKGLLAALDLIQTRLATLGEKQNPPEQGAQKDKS